MNKSPVNKKKSVSPGVGSSRTPQASSKTLQGSSKTLQGSSSSMRLKSSGYNTTNPRSTKHSDNELDLKLKQNRQKLNHTLDTYTLLIRSKNPIRCLQHNSNISIYCETEQKLLCANCIFGRTEHRFHRVTPIDRCYEKLQKDIDTMSRLIDREVEGMKKTTQNLLQNLVTEENDTHDSLTDLIHNYQECHRMLEETFLISKSKIVNSLESVRVKYESLIMELRYMLQNYNVHNIVRPLNKEYFKKEDLLLYEHVICSAIASQRKFNQSDWITARNQILIVAQQEKKKIISVLELLTAINKKHNQDNSKTQ